MSAKSVRAEQVLDDEAKALIPTEEVESDPQAPAFAQASIRYPPGLSYLIGLFDLFLLPYLLGLPNLVGFAYFSGPRLHVRLPSCPPLSGLLGSFSLPAIFCIPALLQPGHVPALNKSPSAQVTGWVHDMQSRLDRPMSDTILADFFRWIDAQKDTTKAWLIAAPADSSRAKRTLLLATLVTLEFTSSIKRGFGLFGIWLLIRACECGVKTLDSLKSIGFSLLTKALYLLKSGVVKLRSLGLSLIMKILGTFKAGVDKLQSLVLSVLNPSYEFVLETYKSMKSGVCKLQSLATPILVPAGAFMIKALNQLTLAAGRVVSSGASLVALTCSLTTTTLEWLEADVPEFGTLGLSFLIPCAMYCYMRHGLEPVLDLLALVALVYVDGRLFYGYLAALVATLLFAGAPLLLVVGIFGYVVFTYKHVGLLGILAYIAFTELCHVYSNYRWA